MSESNFGEFVKEHRLSLRISIRELAERVGRSEATVRSWERGETRPRSEEVFASLAIALKLDEKELRLAAGQELPEPKPQPPPRATPTQPARIPSYRDDPREMVVYWIRGILTAAGLIALFLVLVWAVGGLLDQIGGLFG